MAIQVAQLTKTYGTQKALDGISFETQSHKIIGFLGPNGAGKSTCMKILTGILPATSGTAKLLGTAVSQDNLALKRRVGYLPEHNPLYQDMYVLEALAFEADLQQVPNKKERIAEVIKITGLSLEQHKKIQQLSKGYKQRVGLALAIIHNPEVLILDEPTTGLDPNQIIEIRTLIQNLGKEKTVLLSTHIMQEVEAICDEVIIINRGQLKLHKTKAELQQEFPNKSMEDIFVQFTQ